MLQDLDKKINLKNHIGMLKLNNMIISFVFITGCNAQSNQIVIHDPVAIQAEGKYYIYGTGPGIESAVSADKINWTKSETPLFDPMPSWFKQEVPNFNGHVWAPDISFHNGEYYLYYSISSFGSNLSCIGVATNSSLDKNNKEYHWNDHGIIIRSEPGIDDWNAIDPNLVFDENGIPWLAFGSFWSGIKMVQLKDDLLSLAEPGNLISLASRKSESCMNDTVLGNTAIEGPFIIYKDRFYYLFVSFDLCCRGVNSTYNVRVGRSQKITGPYVDKVGLSMLACGGTPLIQGNNDFNAIGHNSVYLFDSKYYMFSHGYDTHDNGKPKLLVHLLDWDEAGWPFIKEYYRK